MAAEYANKLRARRRSKKRRRRPVASGGSSAARRPRRSFLGARSCLWRRSTSAGARASLEGDSPDGAFGFRPCCSWTWRTSTRPRSASTSTPRELRPGSALRARARRRLLGVALYSEGEHFFWARLAYLAALPLRAAAVLVGGALPRARGRARRLGHILGAAAVYMATAYPLIYWHANLPRHFGWFLDGDFAALPPPPSASRGPSTASRSARTPRALCTARDKRRHQPRKDIVVATTAACWYAGIVAYTGLRLHRHEPSSSTASLLRAVTGTRARGARRPRPRAATACSRAAPLVFLATLLLLAYAEELLWDKSLGTSARGCSARGGTLPL